MVEINLSTPVERGCGLRKQGGIYIDVGLAVDGGSHTEFLVDPPIHVGQWNLSARGLKAFERDGVTHFMDWVGECFYPNCADFVEEFKRFGLSRRIQENAHFSKISPESFLFLVHPKAYIVNGDELVPPLVCPTGKHQPPESALTDPAPSARCCAGYWYQCVEGVSGGMRSRASFAYPAEGSPRGVTVEYAPALFMRVPMHTLVVVDGNGADKAYAKAAVATTNGCNVLQVSE